MKDRAAKYLIQDAEDKVSNVCAINLSQICVYMSLSSAVTL